MGSTTDTKLYELRDFAFQDGTVLPSAKLAYLDINPSGSKTALVITCFRGKLQSTLNFSSGALSGYRVVVAALFGNGESSSPSNTQGFPSSLSYRDCVRAQQQLVTSHLGISSLDAVVGFSMGGQCTYHWTLMYPDLVKNAVIICSSARTSRHNYQFLEGPKFALQSAVDYVDKSRVPKDGGVPKGIVAFGKAYSAWLTSAEWFDQQAYRDLGYETLSAWDADNCTKGYAGWDPDDLLAKLHMWQAGDVGLLVEGGNAGDDESLKKALGQIKTRVLLMPCSTDQYFRPDANEREAGMIPDATLKVIPSIWGHIAGGGANKVDTEFMDREISSFLKG